MLVLAIKVGESIMIGDDVEVKLLSTNPHISLGFAAPSYIIVDRKKIYTLKKETKTPSDQRQRLLERINLHHQEMTRLTQLLEKLSYIGSNFK